MKSLSAAFTLIIALLGVGSAQAQPTQVSTEYLMTVHIPTERKAIDNNTVIVNILPGGWVKGPKISGKILPPSGGWSRMMPSGAISLDVRPTIETDDGALIFMTYSGVLVMSKEAGEALGRGEVLTEKSVPYFTTAPQFQTAAEKYSWLNKLQGAGKIADYKHTKDDSFVNYDIFGLR